MLEYNMLLNDSVNPIDVFNNLPTSYMAPEERRKAILADRTVPVKKIQEKFIASIRTGGAFWWRIIVERAQNLSIVYVSFLQSRGTLLEDQWPIKSTINQDITDTWCIRN